MTTKQRNNIPTRTSERSSRTSTNMPTSSSKFPRGDPDNLFVNDEINMSVLQNHFAAEGRLSKKVLTKIIKMASTKLANEPTLLRIEQPVFIVGDIHGQYYDLLRMFQLFGTPEYSKYLFLGDYVDRGSFGVECLIHLLALKVNYPNNVFLVRGNHESENMTKHFTFRTECYLKAGLSFYHMTLFAFKCMPLAAVVDGKLFCSHGGISPHEFSLKAIEEFNRFREVPNQGVMCDLLWSDPVEKDTPKTLDFVPNKLRQCSFMISMRAMSAFLRQNNLLTIIRAHQVKQEGVEVYEKNPHTRFPTLFTVFSAPNYCDSYHNRAAVLYYDRKTLQAFPFEAVAHPCVLPNLINGFTWTLPYIMKQVSTLLFHLLVPGNQEIIIKDPTARSSFQWSSKMESLFATLNKMSDQAETALKWKGITPSNYNVLKRDRIFDALEETEVSFHSSESMDSANESWK